MTRIIQSAAVLVVAVTLTSCAGTPVPDEVGLRTDGSIPAPAPPPSSPNCVSSYVDAAEDPEHGIEPISRGRLTAEEARAAIRTIVREEERTEILADVPGYMHAVQYSAMWKFPDDVEFWFPVTEPVVNFRSAARLGSSDLGVNRKRMERIRDIYLDY
jgi:uncharacterized protein (DUF1499 family)